MARSLNSLTKPELRSLAESNGVAYEEDDTVEDLKQKLRDAGITEAPDSPPPSEADTGDGATEEQPVLSEEEQAALAEEHSNLDVEGAFAGGTPGGASESQQTTAASQGGPEGDGDAPGDAPPPDEEDPYADLDPAVRGGVAPIPAMPRNPALDYDDDERGSPE